MPPIPDFGYNFTKSTMQDTIYFNFCQEDSDESQNVIFNLAVNLNVPLHQSSLVSLAKNIFWAHEYNWYILEFNDHVHCTTHKQLFGRWTCMCFTYQRILAEILAVFIILNQHQIRYYTNTLQKQKHAQKQTFCRV